MARGRPYRSIETYRGVVALWLGTPTQFGNPVFDPATRCYQ